MDCEREIEPQISQPRPQHHDSNYHSIHYSIYGHYPNDVDKDSGNPVHQNPSEEAIRVPELKTTVLERLTALTIIQRLASAMTTMTKIMRVRKND